MDEAFSLLKSSTARGHRDGQRQPSLALEDDPVPLYLRMAIAVVTCLLFFSAACVTDPDSWFWGDVLSCSIVFAVCNSLACWFFLSTLPRSVGWGWAIVTRIIAIVPLILVVGILVIWEEFGAYLGVIWGLMAVYAILDARCLVSRDRYPRVGLVKTLLASGIAAMVTTMIDESQNYTMFVGILAISSAIAIQVLAPLGRAVVRSEATGREETDHKNAAASDQQNVWLPSEAALNKTNQLV